MIDYTTTISNHALTSFSKYAVKLSPLAIKVKDIIDKVISNEYPLLANKQLSFGICTPEQYDLLSQKHIYGVLIPEKCDMYSDEELTKVVKIELDKMSKAI